MHRQSYKNVSNDFDHIGCVTSDPRISNFNFVSQKLTLEPIVQIARSLGTKSLDINWIFSQRRLSVAFTITDLKPFNNSLQRIEHQFCRVKIEKAVQRKCSKSIKNCFSWKSTRKVFPKAPFQNGRLSSRMTMRKMFDAKRKELTVNIL